jgi:myo-inositol 2-dehydrogenase/D-chiro-inositol 1-dehydrogenase
MVDFCLFGAGRIGKLHARNIAENPRARLAWVYDPVAGAAEALAREHGAKVARTVEEPLADKAVGATLVASSTNTHVDLLVASAKAGKAVLCEKPIDLDIKRVDACLAELKQHPVPAAIGFNRRFDPTNQALKKALDAGEVGAIEQVIITSRDPGGPPAEYIKVSGGKFRDMTIHDFDMARWLLPEEPVEVFATGSCLIYPETGKLGDIDSSMVVMRTKSGVLCHINNSRRAVYGYDQRMEVFGAKGMIRTENHHDSQLRRTTDRHVEAKDPLLNFFLERYARAYANELNDFLDAVEGKTKVPMVGPEDGRRALLLADAAVESSKTGRAVKVA